MLHDTQDNRQSLPTARATAGQVQMITGDAFDRLVLQGQGPIAVEFMSYGCSHCRAIEPILQRVAEMVEANEKIFQVNVAVDQELAETFDIQGTPTFVMFLNGQEAGRVDGPRPTVSGVLTAISQPFERFQ
ncbi:MAG: thioredoxin family protein [Gammaproteobacteria bacterium]